MSTPDPDVVAAYVRALGRPIIAKAEYIDLIHYRDQEPDRSSPTNEANCYLPLFAGKRLLLIAPFAHFLRQRAHPETFARVWAKTGKSWFWPATVDSIEFPYGYDTITQQTYGDALQLL